MKSNENSIINTFDFSGLDDLDPCLSDGHKPNFDKEIQVEIRISSLEDTNKVNTSSSVPLKIRLLIIGDELTPSNIRLELTSEQDLFFYYLSEIDHSSFRRMQESQKLKCSYIEILPYIKKIINKSISEPNKYKLLLNIKPIEGAKFEFIQLLGHKEMVILSVNFQHCNDDMMRKITSFRFNYLKSKLIIMNERVNTITGLIESKNPTLSNQIHKVPARLTEDFIKNKMKSINVD